MKNTEKRFQFEFFKYERALHVTYEEFLNVVNDAQETNCWYVQKSVPGYSIKKGSRTGVMYGFSLILEAQGDDIFHAMQFGFIDVQYH